MICCNSYELLNHDYLSLDPDLAVAPTENTGANGGLVDLLVAAEETIAPPPDVNQTVHATAGLPIYCETITPVCDCHPYFDVGNDVHYHPGT